MFLYVLGIQVVSIICFLSNQIVKCFFAGYSWFHVVHQITLILNPDNIYLFKFNNWSTRRNVKYV